MRFAQHRSGQMQQKWDAALVRHIYDAHCIGSKTQKFWIFLAVRFSLGVCAAQQIQRVDI